MTKYILDTNIVSYLERTSSVFYKPISQSLAKLSDRDNVFISILTIYEFQHSIALINPEEKERLLLFNKGLSEKFHILPLTTQGAFHFSEIKTSYQKKTGISHTILERHNIDFMLASTTLDIGAVLVSNDGIFKKIKDLNCDFQLENWAK